MYAYRSSDEGKTVTGESDGGESGSGERLGRLLELSGCENVIVVVSRWYGGVPLGSDRWKRISEVAKEVLREGEFMKGKGQYDKVNETARGNKNGRKKR